MTNRRTERISIALEYHAGKDEPERGVFRNFPVDPKHTNELTIAIRPDLNPDGETVRGVQVHLIGNSRSLEELGRYLISMARLVTSDPEPYGSFDDVRNADGGTIRLLPRRLERP